MFKKISICKKKVTLLRLANKKSNLIKKKKKGGNPANCNNITLKQLPPLKIFNAFHKVENEFSFI